MPTDIDSPVRYSTIQEITSLYQLPSDKAALLLAKSNAAISHVNAKPCMASKKEYKVFWVQQGLRILVRRSINRSCLSWSSVIQCSLDIVLRQLKDYRVAPSIEVHGLRSSIMEIKQQIPKGEADLHRRDEDPAVRVPQGVSNRKAVDTGKGVEASIAPSILVNRHANKHNIDRWGIVLRCPSRFRTHRWSDLCRYPTSTSPIREDNRDRDLERGRLCRFRPIHARSRAVKM